MDDPLVIPGLLTSSGDSSDKVRFHTFCLNPNELQELISEYSSEASIEEEEKQPELGDLTDDGSSEEEESPILEEPKKSGPMEGFLFTSPAVKVRGLLLECNPACKQLLRSFCIWGCSISDLSTFIQVTIFFLQLCPV